MVRRKIKWKFVSILHLILLNVVTKSLPIPKTVPSIAVTDSPFTSSVILEVIEPLNSEIDKEEQLSAENGKVNETVRVTTSNDTLVRNSTTLLRNDIRPGQNVRSYDVHISVNGGSFSGRVLIDVSLDVDSRDDPIVFNCVDLDIHSVQVVLSPTISRDVDFWPDDGRLEVFPEMGLSAYVLHIEFSGTMRNDGRGLTQGDFIDNSYLVMNLHPTYARYVFPCMDEPDLLTSVSFTFHDIEYNNIVSNSAREENSDYENQFRSLAGPPHRWGMVAHNFNQVALPTTNVRMYGRPGLSGQELPGTTAVNYYFNALNEWTEKPYTEIDANQEGNMNIIILPDTDRDWYALSTVCIWEPYVYMETTLHSVSHRKTAFIKIAEAMAKQWFGYTIYPRNWRDEWVVSGLGIYAAYEVFKSFQTDPNGLDVSLLDGNVLFVTDVIQESMLRDAYRISLPLESEENMFDDNVIRQHVGGLLRLKAPAILRMLRLVIGDSENDFIQTSAARLLNRWASDWITSARLFDELEAIIITDGNGRIWNVREFLEPWVLQRGYPVIHVGMTQSGVIITQESFSFTDLSQTDYVIPVTYTTSDDPDFSDDKLDDIHMVEGITRLTFAIEEEGWVVFNVLGQGYYRVNYDNNLWEMIIEALEDPERREEIHHLNRATLVDDALNLARGNVLDYDIAFRVVLSMEHETDYAVWKAFVRNMNFLRKRLVALVTDDDDGELDPDIYLRMVRRTIGRVENEIGFYPDPLVNEPAMVTLTRGLVMDHACRANYQPCIAAAVDWFYDPNSNEPVVNPNIPHEIRPVVYCSMVREGDDEVIAALYSRLEIEPTLYERLVILESLACSQDENFIRMFLEETIANNSPYGVEERSRIFSAVAESSYQNARIANNFLSLRTNEIRNMYGGAEKLEELLFVMADNIPNDELAGDFRIWVNSMQSNLEDSHEFAERVLDKVDEDLEWNNMFMELVYEWIDENDAPTLAISLVLLCLSLTITMLN